MSAGPSPAKNAGLQERSELQWHAWGLLPLLRDGGAGTTGAPHVAGTTGAATGHAWGLLPLLGDGGSLEAANLRYAGLPILGAANPFTSGFISPVVRMSAARTPPAASGITSTHSATAATLSRSATFVPAAARRVGAAQRKARQPQLKERDSTDMRSDMRLWFSSKRAMFWFTRRSGAW